MNREILRLMTDDDILEGMKISMNADGFREKTVNELLGGARKLLDVCTREELLRTVFAEDPEKAIRPFIDHFFPYMSFNKIGWYGVALRILGDCIREIASHDLNEDDIKALAELDVRESEKASAAPEKAPVVPIVAPGAARKKETDKRDTIAGKKAARKLSLPVPNARDAANVIKAIRNDEQIAAKRAVIERAVSEAGKENTDVAVVFRKVNALVSVYGPVGINREEIARQIVSCNIDKALANGDENVVKILTDSLHDKRQKKFYIFAVRYCMMHDPEHYPLYNAGTARALKYCRDNHGFYNFANDELLDYGKYKKILALFRKKYSLNDFSLREISWVLADSGELLAGK